MRRWRRTVGIALMLGASAVAGACGGDGRGANLTATNEAPGDVSPTPTGMPTATATPTSSAPIATRPPRHLLGRGEMVPAITGICVLILDPATGGGELWDFSAGGAFVASGERSYRWVQYGGADSAVLLDTETGMERDAVYKGEPLYIAKVGPGGDVAMGQAGGQVGLFSLPSLAAIALLGAAPSDWERSSVGSVEWSADGRSVAVIRGDGTRRLIDIVVDGVPIHLGEAPGGAIQWSGDGRRVAVTGEGGTVIYDAAGGAGLRIDAAGWNPQWSADDRHVAIAHPGNLDAVRIFASEDGREVLRVTGAPVCVADYWYADGTIAGGGPWLSSTTVPEGTVVVRDEGDYAGRETSAFSGRGVVQEGTALRLRDDGGAILAEVRLMPGVLWSWPSTEEGVQPITSDGRGVVYLNRGGRGVCDAGWPEPAVYLPPFGSDGWQFADRPARQR